MKTHNNDVVYQEYISRVNRVQDYIYSNLDKELTLKELAGVAQFSEYHFHRIFTGITNETLYKYINRQRLERASNILISRPTQSITEVALDCGFSDSTVFARSFKKHFMMSARDYRSKYSKNGHMNSKDCKDDSISTEYNVSNEILQSQVDVRNMPEMTAVYLRYTGPYKNNAGSFKNMIRKLLIWANSRDLINPDDFRLFCIYHDNPEITADHYQRTSICLAVADDTEVSGTVGKMIISAGRYAVGHFEISADQFEAAWHSMYGNWLPSSGFQADDRPCFEMYLNHPDEHPQNKSLVDIYLPVKAL